MAGREQSAGVGAAGSQYLDDAAPLAGAARPPSLLSNAVKILVNERQRKNPIIANKLLRNVEYEFASGIVPDFVLTSTACALFLSMRYHQLKPTYISQRVDELRSSFR